MDLYPLDQSSSHLGSWKILKKQLDKVAAAIEARTRQLSGNFSTEGGRVANSGIHKRAGVVLYDLLSRCLMKKEPFLASKFVERDLCCQYQLMGKIGRIPMVFYKSPLKIVKI